MRLLTIRFSHYCEKARWALDRYGVPYDEEGFLPGMHLRAVKKIARGEADRASSPYSTPLLVTDDGDVLTDSRTIVRWASERFGDGELYPSDDVDTWEQRLHDRLGVHTRRLAYAFLFDAPALLGRMARTNVGGLSSVAFSAATPLVASRLKKRMRIDDGALDRSLAVINEELDAIDEVLTDGRRFLVGDRFTAADLALACAAAPALVVQADEGYGAHLPSLDALPPRYRALADGWRTRPSGKLAMRMFATERGARVRPYGGPRPRD
jgi:glutathione S-transferase